MCKYSHMIFPYCHITALSLVFTSCNIHRLGFINTFPSGPVSLLACWSVFVFLISNFHCVLMLHSFFLVIPRCLTLCADFSEHSVCSIFIGVRGLHHLWRWMIFNKCIFSSTINSSNINMYLFLAIQFTLCWIPWLCLTAVPNYEGVSKSPRTMLITRRSLVVHEFPGRVCCGGVLWVSVPSGVVGCGSVWLLHVSLCVYCISRLRFFWYRRYGRSWRTKSVHQVLCEIG